jgi:hypothetical protein
MIAQMFGPIPGSRHDSFMLLESKLLHKLQAMMPVNGITYTLFGDPAYSNSHLLYGGYRTAANGSEEAKFNKLMARVRQSVEWGYKEIISYWRRLNFKADQMVFKQPVA